MSAASEVVGIVACAQTTSSTLADFSSVNFVVVACDGSRGTVSELAASTESCRVAVASVQDALGAGRSIRVAVQLPVALYPAGAGTEAETVTLAEQAWRFAVGLGSLGVDALVVEVTELSSAASNANEENLGASVQRSLPRLSGLFRPDTSSDDFVVAYILSGESCDTGGAFAPGTVNGNPLDFESACNGPDNIECQLVSPEFYRVSDLLLITESRCGFSESALADDSGWRVVDAALTAGSASSGGTNVDCTIGAVVSALSGAATWASQES